MLSCSSGKLHVFVLHDPHGLSHVVYVLKTGTVLSFLLSTWIFCFSAVDRFTCVHRAIILSSSVISSSSSFNPGGGVGLS